MKPLGAKLHHGVTRARFNELRVAAEAQVLADDERTGASADLRSVHARFFRTLTLHLFTKECSKFFQDASGTHLQRIKKRRSDGFTFLVPFSTKEQHLECLEAYHHGIHQRNCDLAHKFSSDKHWPSGELNWIPFFNNSHLVVVFCLLQLEPGFATPIALSLLRALNADA